MGKSWYNTGFDSIAAEKDRLARLGGPDRLWIKEGSPTRSIVLLDDEPFVIYEHNWRANGTWRNWTTCLADTSDVLPCCDKLTPRNRSWTGFFTCIDCTERKDAKGNSYQYGLMLLPTKLQTAELLKKRKESKGSLVGAAFNVTRITADDPNVGNDWEYDRPADMEKLFKVAQYKGKKIVDLYKEASENPDVLKRLQYTFALSLTEGKIAPKLVPFNYASILAPKSVTEVRQLLGSIVAEGGPANKPDDEIPF